MYQPYRTLFVGTLIQESFLSIGGTDDPTASMDSPLCRDGSDRQTLRGTSLAGALIATLRRIQPVPASISGSKPSVWRCFNSHPLQSNPLPTVRQHVAIDAQTGGAKTGMLFDVETLPPQTRWAFLLEVDTSRDSQAAGLARQVLGHWCAGRCLLGREVARGLGWMRLIECQEYQLTNEHIAQWPQARATDNYPQYIAAQFAELAQSVPLADAPLPGWYGISGTLTAGDYQPTWHDVNDTGSCYGLDSLSIGGHASEELLVSWNDHFLAPDGMDNPAASFDPDFTVVTYNHLTHKHLPYIPGSSLRGPLRHALARLVKANVVDALFGHVDESAKLLICDAFPDDDLAVQLAWFQHHAEDEFAGGTCESAKFDRVAVMQGQFRWKMVVEDANAEELEALKVLFTLANHSQIGLGGGQWRGHGWLHWHFNHVDGEESET